MHYYLDKHFQVGSLLHLKYFSKSELKTIVFWGKVQKVKKKWWCD